MNAGSWIYRAERGLTLAEVLVAGALGLLLLAVMVSLFLGGSRLWARCSCRSELQQTGTILMERLVAELRDSVPSGVTWDPTHLCIAPPRGLDPAGQIVWEGNVLLYYADGQVLRLRRPAPASPGLACPAIPSARLAAACAGSQPQDVALTRDLERFRVDGSGPVIQLELALARREPQGGTVRFAVQRSVLLRTP